MGHVFHSEQLEQQQCMEPGQRAAGLLASASRDNSSLPTMAQLTRIFSAAICSLVMAFFFFLLPQGSMDNAAIVTGPLFTLAGQVVLVGALLALGGILFAGIPLAIVAWQSTPRSRFLLAIPFLALVLPLLAFPFSFGLPFILLVGVPLSIVAWRSTQRIGFLLPIPLLAMVLPLVTSLLRMPRLESLIVLFADLLLTVAAWRLTPPPRISFRLLIPFLAIALLLVTLNLTLSGPPGDPLFPFIGFIGDLIGNILSYNLPIIGNLGNVLIVGLICGMPIISTIAINRAMRQATIPDKWLRFSRIPSRIVAFALVVMFLGLFFWGVYLAIFAPALFLTILSPLSFPWNSWLVIFIGMLISVIAVARALSSVDSTPF